MFHVVNQLMAVEKITDGSTGMFHSMETMILQLFLHLKKHGVFVSCSLDEAMSIDFKEPKMEKLRRKCEGDNTRANDYAE
jgi:hypothetical protein